jgi:hypothetical protein
MFLEKILKLLFISFNNKKCFLIRFIIEFVILFPTVVLLILILLNIQLPNNYFLYVYYGLAILCIIQMIFLKKNSLHHIVETKE